jgi:glycosyltransferase involved in cell wall biosynthesis/4-amino-4-deoxy-L-arabinose transferase-like glycosyltransferase
MVEAQHGVRTERTGAQSDQPATPQTARRSPPADQPPPNQLPFIAVLIPCHNEELTIGKVVDDFRLQLPRALIVVVDNCSTDATAAIAAEHGAMVLREPRRGKGFAVESMFTRVDADIYIMVDGDDTYPAEKVHDLLAPIIAGEAEMTVGARLSEYTEHSFRPLHVMGNNLVRRLVNLVGQSNLTDIMTGYRAMTRHAVSRLPVVSSGFEIETELTLQMLYYRLKIVEVPVPYRDRPAGSRSKLRTFHDGFRVLWKIFSLFRSFKPLTFFGSVGLFLLSLGIVAGLPPIRDYLTHPEHFVSHVPLAILATGLVLLSFGSIFLGILLHAINWRFLELHNVLTRERAAAIGRGDRTGIVRTEEHAPITLTARRHHDPMCVTAQSSPGGRNRPDDESMNLRGPPTGRLIDVRTPPHISAGAPEQADEAVAPATRRTRRLALASILVYAAIVRVSLLDVPFHTTHEGTGAFQAILARNYVRLPWSVHKGIPALSMGYDPATPVTLYYSHPPLVPLTIAAVYQAFGEGDWQTRLPAAVSTLATILTLYLLVARLGRPRGALLVAALYASVPMVLYFGGQPEFPNSQFTLLCLLAFAAFVRFCDRPDFRSLTLMGVTFALAATADWPAFYIAPIAFTYFVATRRRRQWGWVIAFAVFSAGVFFGLYAHVALAATADWTWMAVHLRTRTGGSGFTTVEWLQQAWAHNVTLHTIPVMLLAATWVLTQLARPLTRRWSRWIQPDSASPVVQQGQMSATSLAWLVLLWAVLHLLVGRQGVFEHPWWWWPLTPALALCAGLILDDLLASLVPRYLPPWLAAIGVAVLLTTFAAVTTHSTVPRLLDPKHTSEGTFHSHPLLAAAVRTAAPRPHSAVLLVSGDPFPNLWFYADRPLKMYVWDLASFELRLRDQTADLPFGFTQRWPHPPVAVIFPRAYRDKAPDVYSHLHSTYRALPTPAHLAAHYALFDLTARK